MHIYIYIYIYIYNGKYEKTIVMIIAAQTVSDDKSAPNERVEIPSLILDEAFKAIKLFKPIPSPSQRNPKHLRADTKFI